MRYWELLAKTKIDPTHANLLWRLALAGVVR
jgi:hypothetical protein